MANTHSTLSSLFSDIADSIRGKTGSSATIKADEFPSAIDAISTGPDLSNDTAVAADVRSGKTFHTSTGAATGSMADASLTAGVSINTNTGIITGSATSGTGYATTKTKTATAQLPTQAATTWTPTTTDQTITSNKYLLGTQTIKGDANLVAGNIKKNIIIFGVTGTYEGGGSAQSCTISLDDSTSVTIAFEKWMTWEDYVTVYPSGAISIDGSGVVRYTKNSVVFTVKYSGTAVQGTEKIVNGRAYTGTSTVLVTYQYYADPQNVMQSRVLNNGVELSYGSNYIKQGTVLSVQVWARGLYPTDAGVWLKGPSDTGYTQVYQIASVSEDPQTYQFTVVDAGSIVIQATYTSTQYVKATYYSGYAKITVNA